MDDKPYFEVASAKELREKYGLTAENRPIIQLDPSRVPAQFREWIPLAEQWGIGDDLIREDCVRKASPAERSELLAFGDVYDAILADWLAKPESCAASPSPEYIAFSCLGMAWDSASFLQHREGTKGETA
jgi:hypothetical protein